MEKSKVYTVNEIDKIVDDLKNGCVVGFPTDTVYGLAIVYDDEAAYQKLYEIKNRSITKPIAMMLYDVNQIEKVAYLEEIQKKIIHTFLPGPLTVILKAKEDLKEHVTMGFDTIGIRIPNCSITLEILRKVKKPLLVTSANISSEPSLIKAQDVLSKFDGLIDSLLFVDALGEVASTVVDIQSKEVKVLRQGPITIEEIEKVIKEK